MTKRLSLHAMVRRIVIASGICVYLLTGIIMAALDMQEIKDDYASAMITAFKSFEVMIRDHINAYHQYIQRVIAKMPQGSDPAAIRHFQDSLHFQNQTDIYYLLDQRRRIMHIQEPYQQYQGIDLSHFEHIAKKIPVSRVHQSLFTQRPTVSIIYPLVGDRLLVLEKDLESILPHVDQFNLGKIIQKGHVFMLTSDGTAIYHPDKRLVYSRHNLGFELTDWSEPDRRGLQTFTYQGEKYLCYRKDLAAPKGWTLFFAVPKGVMLGIVGSHVGRMFCLYALLCFFLIFALQHFLNKKLSNPVSAMVASIAAHHPDIADKPIPRSKASGTTELARIVDAVNQMAAELKRSNKTLRESEERYRTLVETVTDAVFILDRQGNFTFANPESSKLIGRPVAELLGRPFSDILAPEYQQSTLERFERGLAGENIPLYEVALVQDGGTRAYAELNVTSLLDEDGRTIGRIGVARDITLRKSREREMEAGRRFLENVFNAIQDGITVLDRDLTIVRVNSWIEKMYAAQSPIVGKKCYQVYQQRQTPCPWCPAIPAMETGVLYTEIAPYPSEKHPTGWLELNVYPLTDSQGAVTGIIEHKKDITLRKKAQDALKQSERDLKIRNRLAHVFLTTPDALLYEKVLEVVLETMESKHGVFGYIDQQGNLVCPSMTRDIWEQCKVPQKDIIFTHDQWGGIWGRTLLEKTSFCSNRPLHPPQGHIPIERALSVPIVHGQKVIGLLTVANKTSDYSEGDKAALQGIAEYIAPVLNARLQRDVQEAIRRQSEEALRKERNFNRTLIQASPAFFVAINAQGKTLMVNKAMLQALGYTAAQVEGKDYMATFVPERDRAALAGVFNILTTEHEETVYENRVLTRDGEELLVEWHGQPVFGEDGQFDFFFGVGLNITDKKKIESQLLHAQKMESIGTLAGGIAHDFNNYLQAILGYTQILILDKGPADMDFDKLREIERVAQRASTLARQLLIFGRKIESKLRPTALNHVIKQGLALLRPAIPRMIDIELRLADDLKVVEADPAQIEQIVMNLGVNARDAMPEGGKLVFETKNILLDEDFCKAHPGTKPGDCVLLAASDTGHGMDRETLEHLFDPFYTTKEIGRGTGLGLATVYGIVKTHDGHITCRSQPGQGAVFELYFPAVMAERREDTVRDKLEEARGGNETVLVVDDEKSIQEMVKDLLERFGYATLLADSGEKAIEIVTRGRPCPDLVILDLSMPGMGGKKCLEKMLKIDPGMKVIVASGYSADGKDRETLESGAAGFLGKPYQLMDLLNKAREVLDA